MRILLSFLMIVAAALGMEISRRETKDPCPPENDIYPCFCHHDPDYSYTSIICESLRDMNKLKSVLDASKGYNVSMGFYKSHLKEIPSDLFQGQKFHELHFENSRIDSFGAKPFSGLEDSLTRIHIYGCVDKRRKDLDTLPLGHLKKLKWFSFQANDIKRVGNEWFEGGPATVQEVSMEANDIEQLGDKAFASLTNVQQIWLGDNRFGVVARSMFPRPAPKLHLLEISFNGIEVLPDDLFDDMPALNRVTVSGNKLKSLPESTWGKVWNQLDELYFDRTQLVCDDNIKWIIRKQNIPQILVGRCYGDNEYTGRDLSELPWELSLEEYE